MINNHRFPLRQHVRTNLTKTNDATRHLLLNIIDVLENMEAFTLNCVKKITSNTAEVTAKNRRAPSSTETDGDKWKPPPSVPTEPPQAALHCPEQPIPPTDRQSEYLFLKDDVVPGCKGGKLRTSELPLGIRGSSGSSLKPNCVVSESHGGGLQDHHSHLHQATSQSPAEKTDQGLEFQRWRNHHRRCWHSSQRHLSDGESNSSVEALTSTFNSR